MDWQFWEKPNDWPIDPPGYVFLAHAFHQIGRATFGAIWDYEPPSAPDDDSDSASERWEELVETAEADSDGRYAKVQLDIARQCLSGALTTAARPRAGGQLIELSKSDWNTENCAKRFERCQIAMTDRFGKDDFAGFGHWLYVEQESLKRYLASIASVEPPPKGIGPLVLAAAQLIKQLWPDGFPPGLKAKERNELIRKTMEKYGKSRSSDQTIRRALAIVRQGKA